MKLVDVEVVEKPWGREIILAHEDEYAGKIIEVKKGHRLSYQYHKQKKETMYVLSGRMKLVYKGGEKILEEGDSVTLEPGDRHRVEALQDLSFIEVSTSQLDDVVRLEDDYGRTE
jgi:mannose-6-phosphate isomerase